MSDDQTLINNIQNKLIRSSLIIIIITLVACAASGPKYADIKHQLPKLSNEKGRIYIYRLDALAGRAIQSPIKIDNKTIGPSKPEGLYMIDILPGEHIISVKSDDDLILPINLKAGQVKYIRLSVEPSFWKTNIRPITVDEIIGNHEIESLHMLTPIN